MGKKNSVLIKSKRRVQKHGEVFTPQWVIDKMIALPGIKEKTEDIFATFLEPSAGEGAFLLAIEEMKLRAVTDKYSKDSWGCYALWALSSIYGIELLEDNLAAARENMLVLFANYYEAVHDTPLTKNSNLYKSARTIIWANVVQGDALTHKNLFGEYIIFNRWEQVPGTLCEVQRRPFVYSALFDDGKQKGGGTQLRMFEPDEQQQQQLSIDTMLDNDKKAAPQLQQYAIINIEEVWKEENRGV